MAKFLTWATDVLEAVDQSAATISKKETSRRRLEGAISDGNASDSLQSEGEGFQTGYASDGRKGTMSMPGQFPDIAMIGSRALNKGGSFEERMSGVPRPNPISSLASFHRRPQDPSSNYGTVNLSDQLSTQSLSSTMSGSSGTAPHHPDVAAAAAAATAAALDPSSALFVAKASSPALAKLRGTRRQVEGRVWADPALKAQFEEDTRKASEAEAKVSIMIKEVEQLRLATARAQAAHAQEKETLAQEQTAAKAALQKEAASFATSKAEWEMRRAELEEESATYAKALASIQRQTEDKAKELAIALEAAKAAEEQAVALSAALAEGQAEPLAADSSEEEERDEEDEEERLLEEQGPGGAVESLEQRGKEGGTEEEEGETENPRCNKEQTSGITIQASVSREHEGDKEFWERRVRQLEQELQLKEQASSRLQSASQREKDLERRLMVLSEQLVMKQNQAEELANDVQALRVHLNQVLQQRAQLRAGEEIIQEQMRGGGRLNRSGRRRTVERQSIIYDEPDTPGRSRAGKGGHRLALKKMARLARSSMDSLSGAVGSVLMRSPYARLSLVAYIFALHFVVLVILALAAGHRKTRETGHLG